MSLFVRHLVTGLTLLHLGPGLAFALLAFGCDDGNAARSWCQGAGLGAFARLTVGAWVVAGAGLLALQAVARARRSRAARGPAWLALLLFGGLLGAAGWWLTGLQQAFLAVPATLAAGWLFVADPLACTAADRDG